MLKSLSFSLLITAICSAFLLIFDISVEQTQIHLFVIFGSCFVYKWSQARYDLPDLTDNMKIEHGISLLADGTHSQLANRGTANEVRDALKASPLKTIISPEKVDGIFFIFE
jgi:hypothetical protein